MGGGGGGMPKLGTSAGLVSLASVHDHPAVAAALIYLAVFTSFQ